MTASFNCPHCEATYPSLPTLYGRTVRCSTCKKPFRLRGDGTAEKVTTQVKADGTKRVERSTEEKEQLTRAFISKSHEAQKPATKRLQKRQDNQKDLSTLKQSMSTALNAAASEAIAVEERKQQSSVKTRQAKLDSSQGMSAVLTGQGSREQKQFYVFTLGCSTLLLAIAVLYFVLASSSPIQHALNAYVVPTDEVSQPRKRALGYLKRNLLLTYNGIQSPSIILNVNSAQVADTSEFDLTLPGLLIQDNLTNLINNSELAMWVEANKLDKVNALWETHQSDATPQEFYAAIEKAGIRYYTYDALGKGFADLKLDKNVEFLLAAMLCGTTDEENGNRWAEKLLAGDIPIRCKIASFSGEDGQEFTVTGNRGAYRTLDSYSGLMVQIIGEHWDGEWRIFTLGTTKSLPNNPLQERSTLFKNKMFRRYQSSSPINQVREQEND